MDNKTFESYMKEENKTLTKYENEAKLEFGKTFKVSLDLKET